MIKKDTKQPSRKNSDKKLLIMRKCINFLKKEQPQDKKSFKEKLIIKLNINERSARHYIRSLVDECILTVSNDKIALYNYKWSDTDEKLQT